MNMLNPFTYKEMRQLHSLHNEQGFALMITMMFLVVLSLIGLTAIRSSRVDLQIAGNAKWATDSFYRSSNGNEAATRLLEDIATITANTKTNFIYGETLITDINFDLGKPQKDMPAWTTDGSKTNLLADVFMPQDNISHSKPYTPKDKRQPLTQIFARKLVKKPVGGSVETGRSSSSASSPPEATFDVWSKNRGILRAESIIHTQWLHIDR